MTPSIVLPLQDSLLSGFTGDWIWQGGFRVSARLPTSSTQVYTLLKVIGAMQGFRRLASFLVPQAHPAEQVIPGYNRDTAPAILLPAEPHLQIPRRKGIYQGTSVDLILGDLGQLRQRFPDIPQSVLDELSELIRRSLGVDF
jgi:hypothetical protein